VATMKKFNIPFTLKYTTNSYVVVFSIWAIGFVKVKGPKSSNTS
jgi:hypothetical protein